MVRIAEHTLFAHTRRSRRAVVAVGDVQCRYILENLRNAVVHLPVADDPQPVA